MGCHVSAPVWQSWCCLTNHQVSLWVKARAEWKGMSTVTVGQMGKTGSLLNTNQVGLEPVESALNSCSGEEITVREMLGKRHDQWWIVLSYSDNSEFFFLDLWWETQIFNHPVPVFSLTRSWSQTLFLVLIISLCVMMRLNIYSCLLVLVLGCNVTSCNTFSQ